MDVFEHAKGQLQEFRNSIIEELIKVFNRQKKALIKYNTEKQMYEGEDSKGSAIRPKYAESTIKYKKWKKQVHTRVTLKDTGDFYKSLEVVPYDDYVEITSNTLKAGGLVEKYGEDIFGVQEDLMKEFLEKYLMPKLSENAKKMLKK